MKRILVTGAGGSACYNFVESLRQNPKGEKFYIVGTDISPYHIELSHVDRRYVVPPVSDPQYLKTLNSIITKERIDFLHAQPDGEVSYLARHTKKIKTKTLLPAPKMIDLCQDKMVFNETLSKAGISVPESYHVDSLRDLGKFSRKLIAKNGVLWIRAIRGAGSRAALPVRKFEHAKMWIDYWRVSRGLAYGDFMVSEFLPGPEYAFQSLWRNGKILMSQARERVEYLFGNIMPSGQSSTPSVARTVNNREVNLLVKKAVLALDPAATGIFCADLKTDKRGKVKITEINAGRFFTTSLFFSQAGVNMPYYHVKMGLGEKLSGKFREFDNIPPNWYWVRMVDMGYKLIKPKKWTSRKP